MAVGAGASEKKREREREGKMPGVTSEENGGEGVMVTNGRNGGGAGDGQQAPRKSKVKQKTHVEVFSAKSHL